MPDRITTSADLDALPWGSVVGMSTAILGGRRPVAALKGFDGRWLATGVPRHPGLGYSADELLFDVAQPSGIVTVLYRAEAGERS